MEDIFSLSTGCLFLREEPGYEDMESTLVLWKVIDTIMNDAGEVVGIVFSPFAIKCEAKGMFIDMTTNPPEQDWYACEHSQANDIRILGTNIKVQRAFIRVELVDSDH